MRMLRVAKVDAELLIRHPYRGGGDAEGLVNTIGLCNVQTPRDDISHSSKCVVVILRVRWTSCTYIRHASFEPCVQACTIIPGFYMALVEWASEQFADDDKQIQATVSSASTFTVVDVMSTPELAGKS